MSENGNAAHRQITRAAGVVMIGMALSSLAGLATTMLVSHAFGTGHELDAFYAANRLTEIVFNLMAGGALASAFVPTFTGFLARGDQQGAWRLASSISNLVFLAMTVVAILAALMAPWLVRHILAPGFEDAAQIRLTVELLRIMLISSIVFGISGLLMGILNAHQHFFLPALAPAFYRAGWILGIGFLVPEMGIKGLAWGVVLGAWLHLFVQIPGLRGRQAHYERRMGMSDPSVRLVGRLMAPRLLGVAAVQVNFLVNTILASSQPEGSLAALNLALALMIMPQAVIAQATAIAALPTFSEQFARHELEAMRISFASTLRSVFFLSLPASLGLMLLRKPLVSLLLERGAFDRDSTEMVAWALLWYGAGLVGHALLEVIVRAFFAMQDTRTPVMVGVAAMSLNIVFSLLFSRLFIMLGWAPHGGLALANSLATALECLVLLFLIHRRMRGLEWKVFRKGMLLILSAAFFMILVLLIWIHSMEGRSAWMTGGGGLLLGAMSYGLAALALRLPELRLMVTALFSHTKTQRH